MKTVVVSVDPPGYARGSRGPALISTYECFLPVHADTTWRVLAGSGATHAIVHEGVFAGDGGPRVSAWLGGRGARLVAASDSDRPLELPPPQVARFCPALHEM
jgi:hypothetical protein